MSSSSKILAFKKDKNNNLSEKQCEAFIKDYKEYRNGKISKINNPKTNKPLNDADRIKFIYMINVSITMSSKGYHILLNLLNLLRQIQVIAKSF